MPKKPDLSPEAAARHAESIAAWHRENYSTLSLHIKKGKREEYKRLADARGKSVSGMIQEYMDSEYEKEFGEPIK